MTMEILGWRMKNMENVKDKVESLLLSAKREGMQDLLSWMDENGFYQMP